MDDPPRPRRAGRADGRRRPRRADRRRRRRCRRSTSTTRTAASCSTEITRLPEYYPTRAERAILRGAGRRDRRASPARETLVELGSGTSEKTRLLLRALRDGRHAAPLRARSTSTRPCCKDASAAVAAEFPGHRRSSRSSATSSGTSASCPRHPRRLLAFLGSTIGNLDPAQRAGFLADVRATLQPGDAFLLGTDLVKAAERLVAAYDDAGGRHGGVRQERAARASTATSAPTSTSTRSSTSRCGTPSTSGSRCGCARCATRSCTSARARARRAVRARASRCAPRSRRSSAASGSRPSSPPPGCGWRSGGPTPAGDFALSLSVPV